jgi:hypothetical protein
MADYIWGTGYPRYLQNQACVKDVTTAMRSEVRDTAGAIGASTRSLLVHVHLWRLTVKARGAAGVAGAMCATKNRPPRELKVAELQAALRSDGVSFDFAEREQNGLR